MRKFLFLSLILTLVISCTQTSSQVERDYIQNLEEKNKLLEDELKALKRQEETGQVKRNNDQKSTTPKNYFSIGSTEQEVISVMGDPTSYNDYGIAGKILSYGLSRIEFEKGRVKSYSNTEGNLKVKVSH